MAEHDVYLCLGGNLGDRLANLQEAAMFVMFNMGDIAGRSGIYETQPWQMEDVPAFLNQVIHIRTSLSPENLLAEIRELEEYYGRKRKPGTYLSREMDVDIIYYDQLVHESGDIQIPHPRLHLRRFVLVPLCELAPEVVHPVLDKPNFRLLEECTDPSAVTLVQQG